MLRKVCANDIFIEAYLLLFLVGLIDIGSLETSNLALLIEWWWLSKQKWWIAKNIEILSFYCEDCGFVSRNMILAAGFKLLA